MSLYQQLATEFSNTRLGSEPGWQDLLSLDLPSQTKVLDIGCGNARLYEFLQTSFPKKKIIYTGIDNSDDLLAIAYEKYQEAIKLQKFDLVQEDLANIQDKFDLITMHAVMHHIPHFSHRLSLLDKATHLLNKHGFLHVSFWQFKNNPRYQKKIGFVPELVGMTENEMEENDFIMSWDRGGRAYRFCHYADKAEIAKYDKFLQSQGMQLVKEYRADGKEGDQNWYWLWQLV